MSFATWVIDGVETDGQVARQAIGALIGAAGGLVAAGNLECTQKGTPNMSVQVAVGSCWVPGFPTGGTNPYFFRNSATYERVIAAAGATNPRVDTVVVRIKDKAEEGAGEEALIEALKGTETSEATLSNLDGIASVPNGCYVLAYVLVPAKATTIVTVDIKNVAVPVGIGAGLVGDASIVSGRALVATGNKWSTLTPATKAEAEAGFEPSATRAAMVGLSNGNFSTLTVGGVGMGTGLGSVAVGPVFFICPPRQKWKLTSSVEYTTILL
jgi:hypothetical protein